MCRALSIPVTFILVVVATLATFSGSALAQTPLVRIVGRHALMQDFEISGFKYLSPSGYLPLTYSFTPSFPTTSGR